MASDAVGRKLFKFCTFRNRGRLPSPASMFVNQEIMSLVTDLAVARMLLKFDHLYFTR